MSGPQPGETVWVVDVNNIIHRLYHAIPEQVSPTGQRVNAAVGWVRTLRRLRKDDGARWILPVFDSPGPGWRSEIYPAYKAERPEQDEALRSQWPLVVRVTLSMMLPVLVVPGLEADDLIAAARWPRRPRADPAVSRAAQRGVQAARVRAMGVGG
jgi:DNA polymerase-1